MQLLDEDESYSLEVTAQGAHLQAMTDLGAIRRQETFLQLVQTDGGRYFLPLVSISMSGGFSGEGF